MEENALAVTIRQQIDRWRARGDWQKLECTELLFVRGWANKDAAAELGVEGGAAAGGLTHEKAASWVSAVAADLRRAGSAALVIPVAFWHKRDWRYLFVPALVFLLGMAPFLILAGRDALYFYGQPERKADIEAGQVLEGPQPHDLALLNRLRGLAVPIEDAKITTRDFQMPGAPRHYRLGVHEGIDFYGHTVGVAVNQRTPVQAVADDCDKTSDTATASASSDRSCTRSRSTWPSSWAMTLASSSPVTSPARNFW